MLAAVPQKGAVERDVSNARVLPKFEFRAPVRLVAGGGDPDLYAQAGAIAALLFRIDSQLCESNIIHPSPFRNTPERHHDAPAPYLRRL